MDLSVDEGFADSRYPSKRVNDELLEKIRSIIYMYVEPSKEKSFFEQFRQ
jgi:hypothetical protein